MKLLTKPKTLLTLVAILIATASLIFISIFEKSKIPPFQEFDKQLFYETINEDGLSAHFLYQNQDRFSFEISQSLPLYHGITDHTTYESLKMKLSTLAQIKPPKNKSQKIDKRILTDYLSRMLLLSSYPYLEEPLSPNGGLHTEILLLLSAYPFYEKKDISNYFSILRSFDQFTNSLIQYEQEKKEQGLFMSYTSCEKVMEQCLDYAKDMAPCTISSLEEVYELLDDPARTISFLSESFLQHMLTLYETNLLSSEEFLTLFYEHQTILQDIISPCYQRLADALWILEDSSIQTKGLFYQPNGKAYYEALLSYETGSDKPVSSMKKILEQDLYLDYKLLSEKVSHYMEHSDGTNRIPTISFGSIESQIKSLQDIIQTDFPALSSYSDSLVDCEIVSVPQSLCAYTAPAYYIQTPIDCITPQTIYINYSQTTDSLSLFTALAHEGYPGHLYQHVISSMNFNQNEHALCRSIISYPGFQEGWALYCELYAYDHLDSLCDTDTLEYCELMKLDKKTTLCLYALVDIMIHEEGCDYGSIHQFLSNYGISSPFTTQKIYEYIVESPCNYMKYYMGYLEILECKELAQECWQEDYSDYNFHTLLLEFGSAPFSIIKEEIKASSHSHLLN